MSRRTGAAKLVDWRLLFADLARAGLTAAEVARRLEVNASTVHHWRTGGEPGYSDGSRLVALHAELTARPIPLAERQNFECERE